MRGEPRGAAVPIVGAAAAMEATLKDTTRNLLLGGVCVAALALGGCSSSGGTAVNALLGSAQITDEGAIDSISLASSDAKTSATIKVADDEQSATVTVKNGKQVAGPTKYTFFDTSGAYAIGTNDEETAILYAAEGNYSYNGFVAGYNPNNGKGNIAAGYGGTAPSGTMPTGAVSYAGVAATTLQTVGEDVLLSAATGSSSIDADFASGAVEGTFDFSTVSGPTLGFAGTMSTDKATYSSTDVTYNSNTATGQVIGGFYGPDYFETAGAFDIQSGGTKALGSFGASQVN